MGKHVRLLEFHKQRLQSGLDSQENNRLAGKQKLVVGLLEKNVHQWRKREMMVKGKDQRFQLTITKTIRWWLMTSLVEHSDRSKLELLAA